MKYEYRATESFWRQFHGLSSDQKASVRTAWEVFRIDPFHPSLRTHVIHTLTRRYKETVFSVVIEGDLRAVFLISGNTVLTLDVGTHDLYR